MFDKEFFEHLKADNYYALKLGTLKWLAIGFMILFILNMILWRAGTGIFHILIGSDPAYDGGPGWGSAAPVFDDPANPTHLSCTTVNGDKVCGGSGFNASAIMLLLGIGFFIGWKYYEKPENKN